MAELEPPCARARAIDMINVLTHGEVKDAFLSSAPSDDLVPLGFHFHRDTFESKLNFRVFHLENDVYVSAPFAAVGDTVTVQEGRKTSALLRGGDSG